MSLPSTRSSNTSGSSSRRPSGQPKSGRKQYSACGACRLRRVRCDLRELQEAATDDTPQTCTNCSERGINCVDEYVELKAARRQIARIQKSEDSDGSNFGIVPSLSSAGSTHSSVSPERYLVPGTTVPLPHSDFFRSRFFRHFSLQNPIFDHTDFQFIDAVGDQSYGISIERKLLAMVLLAWAASFGLDEHGVTANFGTLQSTSSRGLSSEARGGVSENPRARTDTLVNGILSLVDSHGLLRNPTWDGARLLLLVWPLTQGTQRSLERTTMFESVLSQVHALCRFDNRNLLQTGQDQYSEALARARVFWYAYAHEGVFNALKGGRLVMGEDDLDGFQLTLPSQSFLLTQAPLSPSSSLPNSVLQSLGTDTSSPFSDIIQAMADSRYRSHPRTFLLYQLTTHHFDLTLHVATVCRRIHRVLTGPRARQLATGRGGSLNIEDMRAIWDGLHRCWDEFESARESGLWNGAVDEICPLLDVDVFASGWQIFLFECHNIVREALKQRILYQTSTRSESSMPSSASPMAPAGPPASDLVNLHMHATHKCRLILPVVLTILKRHLQTPASALLISDIGLVRDGCAFAGFMLAQGDLEGDGDGESLQSVMNLDDGIEVCVRSLDAMRWTFSNSRQTKQTLISAWDARKLRDRERHERSHRQTGNMQPSSFHQWSTHTLPYDQQFGAYGLTSGPSGSPYYPPEGHGTQPLNYPSSSDVSSPQPMLTLDQTNASPSFSPDGWFGYNPTR